MTCTVLRSMCKLIITHPEDFVVFFFTVHITLNVFNKY